MNPSHLFDFAGIGIGPFNLGLSALSAPIEDLNGIFFDQRASFDWHSGMMLQGTHLQVPFMADLVTMVDPTSPYSFLNYSKQQGRLYNFYIREDFYLLRQEYNMYCQWVIQQLDNLRFGHRVHRVEFLEDLGIYRLTVEDLAKNEVHEYYARKLVLGTGNTPFMPNSCKHLPEACHTANYLHKKEEILSKENITIVGGGQSSAEIFSDLLNEQDRYGFGLKWITRSPRFFPLEYSKLTLEMTSPEYVDYFHALPAGKRDQLNAKQKNLYKGINFDLINDIHEQLYQKSLNGPMDVEIRTCSEMKSVAKNDDGLEVEFLHLETEQAYQVNTQQLILATGYETRIPAFLSPIRDRIQWDDKNRFDVARNYSIDTAGDSIFVQNAELHTHGFVTPDLGMSAYRNGYIINQLAGKEIYPLETRIAYQSFGAGVNPKGEQEETEAIQGAFSLN